MKIYFLKELLIKMHSRFDIPYIELILLENIYICIFFIILIGN